MLDKIKSFFFSNISTRQTVAKNTFWLAFGNIGGRLIRAAVLIFAARILAPRGFGVFSYALSLATLFGMFIDLGINSLIIREASKDIKLQKQYFATGLFIKVIMTILAILLLIIAAPLFIKDQETLAILPIVVLFIGFDTLKDFGSSLSRAWERMEIEAGIQIFTNVIIAISSAVGLFLAGTPKSLAIGYLIGGGLGMIAAFIPFREYLRDFRKTFTFSLIKPILSSSWVMGLTGFISIVQLNTDAVMIGFYRSLADVGYYSAAQRIILLILLVPTYVTAAVFPKISKFSESKEHVGRIIQQTARIMFVVAMPATLGGVLLAPRIIATVFGPQYLPAVSSFMIMSCTFVTATFASVLSTALFAIKRERQLMIYSILAMAGNLVFNFLFIPTWGIAGSSASTLVNQIIVLAYLYVVTSKALGGPLLPSIGKVLAATLCMGIFIVSVGPHLRFYLDFGGAILVYFILLYTFKDPIFREVRTMLTGDAA